MANLHNVYCTLVVVHRVDDSIRALPQPVSFLAREFFTSFWRWVIRQRLDALHDLLAVLFAVYPLDFLDGRGFDK